MFCGIDISTPIRNRNERVRAVDNAGNRGGNSTTWSFVIDTSCVDTQAPPAPSTITVPSTSDTGDYRVDWSDVTDPGPAECRGISQYILWEDGNSAFTSPTPYTPTPPDSSYYDFESKPDGGYYYKAQAVDFAGNAGDNSSTVYIDVQRPNQTLPPEPAPPWNMIEDFDTDYGTASYDGDSWGPWVYYEYDNDAGNKVTWVSSKGTQSGVGKFYWGLNTKETARQKIYQDGSWDFSHSDKNWSILVNNENSGDNDDVYLQFRDNQDLWAESTWEESIRGAGWQRLEFEPRTVPAGFNWSGITRIQINVEKSQGYDSDRQLYFDELAWNREIHLESSKYNVYPGDEFTGGGLVVICAHICTSHILENYKYGRLLFLVRIRISKG